MQAQDRREGELFPLGSTAPVSLGLGSSPRKHFRTTRSLAGPCLCFTAGHLGSRHLKRRRSFFRSAHMLALTVLQLPPPPPEMGCDVFLYLKDQEGVTRTGQSGRMTTRNTCSGSLCAKPQSSIQTPGKDNLLLGKKPSCPGSIVCVWLVAPHPRGRSGPNHGLFRRLRTRQRGAPVTTCIAVLHSQGLWPATLSSPRGVMVPSGHSPPAPLLLQLK